MGLQGEFHNQLLNFVENRVITKLKEKPNKIPFFIQCLKDIDNLRKNHEDVVLEKVTSEYHEFFFKDNQVNLESVLLSLIEYKEFVFLGISNQFFPKMIRGLPRIYKKENPAESRIKPPFDHLFFLTRHFIDKAILSLYKNCKIKPDTIGLLFEDNKWDKIYLEHSIKIIEKLIPQLNVKIIDLSSENALLPLVLKFSNPSLQIDSTIEKSEKQSSSYEFIGGYGTMEKENRSSFGLYFLEKGVLTYIYEKDELLNVTKANTGENFYFCSIHNSDSIDLYLSFLMKYLRSDTQNIEVMFFYDYPLKNFNKDRGYFFQELEKQRESIEKIEIIIDGEVINTLSFSSSGKTIRMTYKSDLTKEEVLSCFLSSKSPVGCSADFSFSLAISTNKVFFLDVLEGKSSLLKDLLAIAKNRIHNYKKAILFLEVLSQVQFSYQNNDLSDFVSEDYFQDSQDIDKDDLIKKLVILLEDPMTIKGLKSLNRVIYEEYSANEILVNQIKRALFHYYHPTMSSLENLYISRFLLRNITFSGMVKLINIEINNFSII